jgi:thiamine biosynthesis lipoprotein
MNAALDALRWAARLAIVALSVGCNQSGESDSRSSTVVPPQGPAAPTETTKAPVEPPPVRKDGTIFADGVLMGTSVSINLWLDPGRDPADAGAAMQAAFDEIARLERILSEWQSTSEVSRLNARAGGDPMPLSTELYEVLKRSREISEITGGTFDVTFYGVGQLWKFEPGAKPPAADAVAAKLGLVDWRGIELSTDASGHPRGRLARAGMKVGLGAIAKGYAVDRAAAVLRDRGFANHVVEGGGDTYVSGTKGGKPWMVGVQDPDHKGVLGALPSSNESVVTSGDYERFFEYEGRRYAHILDPKTGYPVAEELAPRSVTMVAANATDADAYCTAVAVMGPQRGMAFVEERPELEAIIITHAGDVLISTGLQAEFVRAPTNAAGTVAGKP